MFLTPKIVILKAQDRADIQVNCSRW